MNKKAITMAFIIAAIIILLLTISLFLFISTVFQKTKEMTFEKKCEVSVNREALLNLALKQEGAGHTVKDFASNVDCQTIPIEVPEKNEGKVIGMIRTFMDKCWKIFGQERELFSRGDGTFCHICYSLTLESGIAVELEEALKLRPPKAKYDVPAQTSGDLQAIVFYAKKTGDDIDQKILVRALDPAQPQALADCADAEFPRQRT